MRGWNAIFDRELGRWCAGVGDEGQERERVCITTQPPIFAHHHARGGGSDIGGLGGGYAREVETRYLRFSVRMNLGGLVGGREVVDQWPGGEGEREGEVEGLGMGGRCVG